MSRTDKGYIIQTSGSLNNKFSSRVSVTVKRRITFRSILLFVLFIVLAKPGLSQGFDGGLLAGFNGSQVRGDLYSNGFHKMGLLAGAWVQTSLNDNFYWTMELKYSQKGSRMNPSKKNDYYLYIYRLNYIDIPVAFGYHNSDYYSFLMGLSFNYLVNRSAEDSFGKIELSQNLHSWEIAAFAGIRIDFEQMVRRDWASKFKLDFRFQFSALPIYTSNNKLFYYSPYSQFNSVISTALYYTVDW
ncbi:MAG TPA: outer membrane beta-barrel protein [Prolixibacteraceae bacterium]|nr:outer membrane beta-barrel protein [Prolixibacteraceae bacterium]